MGPRVREDDVRALDYKQRCLFFNVAPSPQNILPQQDFPPKATTRTKLTCGAILDVAYSFKN
jgi:hypothetical protein